MLKPYILLTTYIRTARKDERGASAVEYGLLVALIAAVIILAVVFLGQTLNTTFDNTGQCIANEGVGCP